MALDDTLVGRAAKALLGASRVAICAHQDPDGDAVGSSLGMRAVLDAMGVESLVLSAGDEMPATYAFLEGFDEVRPASSVRDEAFDVFVALDTTDVERLGDGAGVASQADILVNLDHHPDNAGFGDVAIVDPSAAAVGLMIWEMLTALGVTPGPRIATPLYVALMTDTGRFGHSNTDARALLAATQMVRAGADPAGLADAVYRSRSHAAMALAGRVLSRIQHLNGGKVALSWLDSSDMEELGATSADTEDLVDWVRMEAGPQIAILAKVSGGRTRLSMRSRDDFDVGETARRLGGGGHRVAAGATVDGGLDDALRQVLPLLPGWGDDD
ncbi:MAG: bifunctional oligoribonuclease/PAP phosphatase NrnA [Coriobacteriia bacterium]